MSDAIRVGENALVDVDAVAVVLGIDRGTIYRWARAGRIPCIRAGRKLRFELAPVIEALRVGSHSVPSRTTSQTPRRPPQQRAERARARVVAPDASQARTPALTDAERLSAAVAATRALGE